jgi:putative acetyltransferase
MRIRPIVAEDREGIIDLISSIYAEYDCILNLEEDYHLKDPVDHFRSTGGEFWVVEDNGTIYGTVAVRLFPDSAELKCLYVHPSLRRKGWARKLTELAMNYARETGREKFFLWTDTRFLDAHIFYRNLGFKQNGIRDLKDSNNSFEYGFEITL